MSASPTTPATAAAPRQSGASNSGAAAATDFTYFRSKDVTSATGSSADSPDEPSVANDGNNVLYTGNWYAAESTDSGHSFTYINPYTLGPAPTLPNGGFCCDQVAIHTPSVSGYDLTVWGLLYCNATDCQNGIGNNLIRLAVARNQADLASSTFDYYDFSAQTFGFPNGDWLDYPHMEANNGSVLVTMNVFDSSSNVVDMIVVRFDDSSFASGTWSANWYFNNQDFTWTPTDNSVDSWGYWAATAYNNNSLIRVYNWAPGTDWTHISWNDFSVGFNYMWKNGVCTAPNGQNWCAFDDSRVKTGGEVGTSTVYFMWDAKQGGGFAYPYVQWASFNVSSGPATSVITSSQVWNGSYAWVYPGMGIDGAGNIGVSLQIGGGTWGYPGSQFLVNDDVSGGPWGVYGLASGSSANNRWGDFLTARAATTPGSVENNWIATGYVLDSSGNARPSFYWLGRNRDDPFAPSWSYTYNPSYVEGASADKYVGIFRGPSNCTCDYSSYLYWGDGGFNYTNMYNYAADYFAMHYPHTYGEEGSYTQSMYAVDNFGASASGTGTATVTDAALSATGKTINAAVNVSFSKAVATFTDADPGGTLSDYTATINWGDGHSSAGTISGTGPWTVKGSHTYTTTGIFTVKTTIKDAGGAKKTVSSTANIGNLPVITSVAPTSGTHLGGTTVKISGKYFTGTTSVKFGTTAATSFTVNSATAITSKSPAHATGTVDIRVTTKYGTTVISSTDKYTYK